MSKWRLVDFTTNVNGTTTRRIVASTYEAALERALADMGFEVFTDEPLREGE